MFYPPHSDNIVSLDVYFEDLSYDVIEQTPLYETWALIGQCYICLFIGHCTTLGTKRKRILVPTSVAANNNLSKRQDLDEYFRLTSDTFEHLRIDLIRLLITFKARSEECRVQGMQCVQFKLRIQLINSYIKLKLIELAMTLN